MSDRELLQDAAKAAGYTLREHYEGFPPIAEELNAAWNPITDDGDALRLAVRLHLDINQFPVTDDYGMGMIEIWCSGDNDPAHVEYVKAGDDRLIATRRAIVRAAAELGRQMP